MKKLNLDPEELLRDITSAVDLISKVENINFDKMDINKLKEDAEKIETNLKEKYKDVLKEHEDDLDSEE
tara:strand:+ start:297 stop:503 length:207 start_codon:yes stop_codon:yes gene_type:complete